MAIQRDLRGPGGDRLHRQFVESETFNITFSRAASSHDENLGIMRVLLPGGRVYAPGDDIWVLKY